MLYVFTGNDLAKIGKARESFFKKYSEFEIFNFDDLNFNLEEFATFLSDGDLFSKKYLVCLNNVLETNFSGEILASLSKMEESKNVFIFTESSVTKSSEKELKANAAKYENFEEPKRVERFNIFSITDAFGAKDKKSVWVLMQKALHEGVSAEEILNILIWQVKNLLLASSAKDVKESGLAPFVFNKSKSYAKNFGQEELHDISTKLVTMFHESHLGLELEPNLELFILKSL